MQVETSPDGQPLREQFEFTGSGSEYFRIWIVNLLLTVLTLGIYSAWAKVRRLKYFYQNTRVANGVFDFHGDPLAILMGRILAVMLLVAYDFATTVPGWPLLVAIMAIALLMPWLIRNSFRFRLRNSTYRGLRFSFRGSVADSYVTFLGYGVLTFLTLYLAAPLFHQRLKRFQHGESWFGKSKFEFSAGVGSFYWVYFLVGMITIGAFVLAGVVMGGSLVAAFGQADEPDMTQIMPIMMGAVAVFVLLSFIVTPLFQAKIGNLVWNNTRLGLHVFESRLRVGRLFMIQFTNFVLIALTLGLFTPWAAVRLARYRAECLAILPASSIEEFVADAGSDVTATGEEVAEIFDFDIGL